MVHEWGLPRWFLGAYRILIGLVLMLIVLGGSVRVMDAGLACPDWPLCFGQIFPDFHPQVYFEFIHRALAGLVSLGTLCIQGLLLWNRNVSVGVKRVSLLSLIVLLSQVVMGGLTVILQLKAGVVATHLALGTGFFALLIWNYQSVVLERSTKAKSQPARNLNLCLLLLAAVYLQIILGGLVASNYAANVCPGEFPTCHGEFFPTFSGAIGLQVIHRTWAYVVFVLVATTYFLLRKNDCDLRLQKMSAMLLATVFLQVLVGISNVLLYTPPLIAVIHLLFATLILWVAVRMVHRAGQY